MLGQQRIILATPWESPSASPFIRRAGSYPFGYILPFVESDTLSAMDPTLENSKWPCPKVSTQQIRHWRRLFSPVLDCAGLQRQAVHTQSGFRAQRRSPEAAKAIPADACASANVFASVVQMMQPLGSSERFLSRHAPTCRYPSLVAIL